MLLNTGYLLQGQLETVLESHFLQKRKKLQTRKGRWVALGDNTDFQPSLQAKMNEANSKERLVERENLFY